MGQNLNLSPKGIKVIISGGGTGGHIFPAIAIADAIKKMEPNADILFVGANERMEMHKVPEAGYSIRGLNIAGFQRSLTLKNLSFPIKVLGSLLESRQILAQFKPDVAVGVGGYASGPLLFAAGLAGIPTLIQEQNGYAGITNKLLAAKAKTICVAYPGMEKYFPARKLVFTGNPVRASIRKTETLRNEGLKYFNIDPSKPVLLVIGGSLGARTINQSMAAGLQRFQDSGIQVLWQTGKTGFNTAKESLEKGNYPLVQAFEFITRMDLAYNVANAAVSRAGALSVSELALVGMPSILVPSPNVAEDHQTKNAMALKSQGAAWLIADADANKMLVTKSIQLLESGQEKDLLGNRITLFSRPEAGNEIARQVFKLKENNIGH